MKKLTVMAVNDVKHLNNVALRTRLLCCYMMISHELLSPLVSWRPMTTRPVIIRPYTFKTFSCVSGARLISLSKQ